MSNRTSIRQLFFDVVCMLQLAACLLIELKGYADAWMTRGLVMGIVVWLCSAVAYWIDSPLIAPERRSKFAVTVVLSLAGKLFVPVGIWLYRELGLLPLETVVGVLWAMGSVGLELAALCEQLKDTRFTVFGGRFSPAWLSALGMATSIVYIRLLGGGT